jgi:hypothetical protein
MDAKQSWEQLKPQAGAPLDREVFVRFAEELAASGEPALVNYARSEPKARQAALRRLLAGGLYSVGSLPQFELCLLAALAQAAAGRQVFILSPLSVAPPVVRSALHLLGEVLGLNAHAAGLVFGRPTSRLKQALKADVVLTDTMQLFEVARDRSEFLERPAAVFLCEADICLFDARLGMCDRGRLRALAAVYRSSALPPPWREDENVLDMRDVLGRFERVDGILGYTSPYVARELRKVYGSIFPAGVHCRGTGDFRAFAFRTFGEKMSALCRDILKAPGDCLIFVGDEELRQNLYRQLRQRDQEPTLLAASQDLRNFLSMVSERKRVGIFRGIPTSFSQPIEKRPSVQVFLAEHLLMPHQHGKLRTFCERDLELSGPPTLYLSLEDGMFSVYADRAGIGRFFRLMDFTEKYDKWRQIRRVMARTTIRRIHSLRRAYLNEEYPVFTLVGSNDGPGSSGEAARKKSGKRLEGLCFCGSGKPFRECHGKAKA